MSSTTLGTSPTFVNGGVSFWYREDKIPARRPALPGDLDVDVALVGGGYTALWTAYYLNQAQPDLRIAVLEKEFAGFGASGRNGGWLSAEPHGRESAIALQREMFSSVDEVIRVAGGGKESRPTSRRTACCTSPPTPPRSDGCTNGYRHCARRGGARTT
ncbi:FAD-dependent oxidoreductase [Streptomyces sp. GMR22]|uniref:FAD-dependent oxidoreductase n=1 Tax=Streptomyces sp. GMR22 TaxID=2759524 RepID=UPI003FA37564